jgi:DNA repair exonuclease SbcCD nuclease subunit
LKIAIITDTHFGARNDSPIFLHHFFKFFEEVFFPTIDRHGIKSVIHLGDLMDRRKFVNFGTLSETRKRFVNPLIDRGIVPHIILGNHDVYFRNTNEVNCVQELFSTEMDLIDQPRIIDFDGLPIAFLPWITKDNEQKCLKFASECKAPILMGHLELMGYEVQRGVASHEGMDAQLFKRFEAVYSGHYHCKHSRENIHYLGTPYQFTFGDLYEPKGFHIFDTRTRELEYIQNPSTIFHSVEYDDTKRDYYTDMPDLSAYKEGFVRVVVRGKSNPVMFDRFVEKLNDAKVYGVNILQDKDLGVDSEDQVDASKDTLTLINAEIDGLKVDNPAKLKQIMRDLYNESLFS